MVDGGDPGQISARLAVPPEKGTYLLFCRLVKPESVSIGRLGAIHFRPGLYGYVGSAFGPGGLAARLGRHLQASPRRHWHIDYLKPFLRPVSIWFSTDPVAREHRWAAALLENPDQCRPIDRFGCSDCACRSHLFLFTTLPSRRILLDTHAVEKIGIS